MENLWEKTFKYQTEKEDPMKESKKELAEN